MKEDLEKVKLLARDLRKGKEYPRSPRETPALAPTNRREALFHRGGQRAGETGV